MDTPIAVIGMSCRFSGGVTSPEKLWELLIEGKSGWSEFPASRFDKDGFHHPDSQKLHTMNVKGGHFLQQDISHFDAAFFGLSAETAASLDPQIRFELETSYEAFENAGLKMEDLAGSNTSVFAGTFFRDYHDAALRDPDTLPRFLLVGTGSAMASNRLSHLFDLRGPSMSIDTGCSSTMVALHQACQSLRMRESEMSLVTGANIMLNPDNFISMTSLGLISPDGRSWSFDNRANGYGRGEGCAAVVLKRLDDAIRDGDPIRAVIRGSASNQDGKSETITTPSQQAQETLMRQVYSDLNLDFGETGYFEAHGTGTRVGDPLECAAIHSVFGKTSYRSQHPLLVGSVKSNLGHTEPVSGLASIIKAVLILEKGQIPPTINVASVNPSIILASIRIPTQLEPWPESLPSRRISVNNFGYGGANVHVVMDSYNSWQAANASTHGTQPCLESGLHGTSYTREILTKWQDVAYACVRPRTFVLSAKDELSAQAMAASLQHHLEHLQIQDGEDQCLADLAYTLGERRTLFSWRSAVSASNVDTLIKALGSTKAIRSKHQPRLGFVFTGQGAQWHAMGRELIWTYPVFRDALLRADAVLDSLQCPWSLIEELLRSADESRVNNPALSMPLCTAVQVALVELLRSWGATPAAVTSHSSGEIASAYAAGALSLQNAMVIAYARGSLASEAAERCTQGVAGGMMAVGLAGEELATKYLPRVTAGQVVIACYNSPSSTTVSGDVSGLEQLEAMLKQENVFARRLKVDEAYHSPRMRVVQQPYLEWLIRSLEDGRPFTNNLIYSSPTTGSLVAAAAVVCEPQHWVTSLISPVRFEEAFMAMCLSEDSQPTEVKFNVDVIIEVGPHAALGGPIADIFGRPEFGGSSLPYFACLDRKKTAVETSHALACNLIKQGCVLNMNAVNDADTSESLRVLTDLPSYPWAHGVRHWVESRHNISRRQRKHKPHDLLGMLIDGCNPMQPTWRLFVRPFDMPWVRDHEIQGGTVYPGGGFICMAIEAACQSTVVGKDASITAIELSDIDLKAALVVPDTQEGIELQLTLLPIGANAQREFRIYSVIKSGQWTEHCAGFIKVHLSSIDAADDARTKCAPRSLADYRKRLDSRDLYSTMKEVGIHHGPPFQNLRTLRAKTRQAVAVIQIPDTAALMPYKHQHPHVMHPVVLDTVFQAAYAALPHAGSSIHACLLPRSIRKMWISTTIPNTAGSELRTYVDLNNASEDSFNTDIAVTLNTDNMTSALLKIDGFQLQSIGKIPESPATIWKRQKFSTAKWLPEFSLLQPQELRAYSNSEDLPLHLSFALRLIESFGHTNPRGKILELDVVPGDLAEHVLQKLSPVGPSHVMVGHYDLACSSAEQFETAKSKLDRWSHVIGHRKPASLGASEARPTKGGEYDLIVARGTFSDSSSDIQQRLQAMHGLLRDGGRAIFIEQTNAQGEGTSSPIEWHQALGNLQWSHISTQQFDGGALEPGLTGAVLVATKLSNVPSADADIVIVTGEGTTPHAWLERLVSDLESLTGRLPIVSPLGAHIDADKVVVMLAELEAPILTEPTSDQFNAIRELSTQAKGLLWLSRGASMSCEKPGSALATGMLRCLRTEYQGRKLVALDLDPAEELWSVECIPDIVRIIAKVFLVEDDSFMQDYEFCLRSGVALVPRYYHDVGRNDTVASSRLNGLGADIGSPASATALLKSDGSYLVVGGLGGIGTAICEWLADRGAKHIIVASRSAGCRTNAAIEALKMGGCQVKTISCDVASEADVERMISECNRELPPICGVIQAAMVLRDSIFEQMKLCDWTEATKPKVKGTWNLHRQLRGHHLDFFVILSSLAGIFGIPSQCNYGAGGTFEDAVAKFRMAKGLPCVTIDVGVVLNVGVVSDNEAIEERLRKSEHSLLSEDDVLAAIESAVIDPPASGQMLLGLNPGPGAHWEYSGMARDLRFAAIKYHEAESSDSTSATINKNSLAAALSAAESRTAATTTTVNALAEKLKEIFMVPDVDVDSSPSEQGVDSLIAVELRNMIALQAGAEVSIFEILSSESLTALASTVVSKSSHVTM